MGGWYERQNNEFCFTTVGLFYRVCLYVGNNLHRFLFT